jgi:hypothetical protein
VNNSETTVPLGLLTAGILILLGIAFASAGAAGVVVIAFGLGVYLAINVVLGILACYATASLCNTSFGFLGTASLKLAAIITLPLAIAALIPAIGWLIALILYLVLIGVLFELEPFEVMVFVLVLMVIRFLARLIAVSMLGELAV